MLLVHYDIKHVVILIFRIFMTQANNLSIFVVRPLEDYVELTTYSLVDCCN